MSTKTTKKGTYFHIYDWMTSILSLKNNELIVFALIYSFSNKNDNKFRGSLKYLALSISASKATVQRALKSLVTKGYITKKSHKQNNITLVDYCYSKSKMAELGISSDKENISRNHRAYITIHSWMINNMCLSGHKLTVFAILYSFCTNSNKKFYSGSFTYIAKRLNMCSRQVKRILDLLEGYGFIKCVKKFDQKSKSAIYKAMNCHQFEKKSKYSETYIVNTPQNTDNTPKYLNGPKNENTCYDSNIYDLFTADTDKYIQNTIQNIMYNIQEIIEKTIFNYIYVE